MYGGTGLNSTLARGGTRLKKKDNQIEVRKKYPPPRVYSGCLGALYRDFYWGLRSCEFWMCYHVEPDDESEELELVGVRYKPESLEALCKLTRFSRKELQLMYRGFKQGCPNGIVSLAQFKEIYAQFFPQGDPTRYAHFVFNTFDRDGNGQISFEEFALALSVLSKGSTEEKLKWVFELYDIRNRGFIRHQDLHDVVQAIYDMVGKYTDPAIDAATVPQHVDEMFKVCYYREEMLAREGSPLIRVSSGCSLPSVSPKAAYSEIVGELGEFFLPNGCYSVQDRVNSRLTDCICHTGPSCETSRFQDTIEKRTNRCHMAFNAPRHTTSESEECIGHYCFLKKTSIRGGAGFRILSFRKGCLNLTGPGLYLDPGRFVVSHGAATEETWFCDSEFCNSDIFVADRSINHLGQISPAASTTQPSITTRRSVANIVTPEPTIPFPPPRPPKINQIPGPANFRPIVVDPTRRVELPGFRESARYPYESDDEHDYFERPEQIDPQKEDRRVPSSGINSSGKKCCGMVFPILFFAFTYILI